MGGLRTLHSAAQISRIGAHPHAGAGKGAARMFGKTKGCCRSQEVRTPGRFCMVETGNKFCSDHCRDAHGMIELNWQCCHAGCECGPAS